MADKYCIASGTFTDTNIWSLTENGAGGAGYPGTGEDIYFTRSVTVEKFHANIAANRSVFVSAGVDCTVEPMGQNNFSLTNSNKLVVDGILKVENIVTGNGPSRLYGASRLEIAPAGKLVLSLSAESSPWNLMKDYESTGAFINLGTIAGNEVARPTVTTYFVATPEEFVPGKIEGALLDIVTWTVNSTGVPRYRTLTGLADLSACRLQGTRTGTSVLQLQSAEAKIGSLEFLVSSADATVVVEQSGRLFLSGDMVVSDNTGAIEWTRLTGSESTFTGTADQVITMPDGVEGQYWFVDKPAGTLDLENFDGFLQGRLRNLTVRTASSIDLSGPAPSLMNSLNEPALFHGLKGDACLTDSQHSIQAGETHGPDALDSCVNYGRITIPQGKALCCKIFDNRTGASVLGHGILCVEYGGLTNLGSIAPTISVQYFNVPHSIDLDVAPSSGIVPLTVTAQASDFGLLRTFDWGNGHVTGPVSAVSAEYTYQETGLYTVTVTATDSLGTTLSASRPVTVLPPPSPPQARMSVSPWQGIAPLQVELSTEGSEGSEMAVDWGDGSTPYGPITGIAPRVSHVYESDGRFLAKLSVWNVLGALDEASQVVSVLDSVEIHADLTLLPSAGEAPLTILADASESHGDDFLFVWGDGTSDGPQPEPRAMHTFTRPGYYSVTLTTTKAGLTVSAVRGVTVFLAAPLPPTTIVPSPLGPLEPEAREKHYGIPRGNMPSLYRLTLAQGICYMNDTLRLSCPMTSAGRALHNGSALFLGRVTHADDSPVSTEEIDAAVYSIHRLDQSDPTIRTPVEGHTEIPLTLADILLPDFVTDANWTFDETGYNFRYALDDTTHSPFPVPGRQYLVSFVLTPADASPKIRIEYRIHVV